MTNGDISKVLYEIAQMLELTDVSRFEIIAYQVAARNIENIQEDIEAIYKEGGLEALDTLPGVGKGIAKNIAELIETGKLEKVAYLLKKIPAVQLEINAIPGVGPKTTLKLYKALKPKNMADFIKNITDPKNQVKLAELSFKEKTIANILRGIEIREKLSVRIPLTTALPIAEYFVEAIEKVPGVVRVDTVGSLRRMKDMVGDIDIIACSDDPKIAIATFVGLGEVKQKLAQGPISARIIHTSGVQVDFKILPKAEYGSLLQHFTGSKEHNVELRTYAQKHNFSISEHGIKDLRGPKEKMILCSSEEVVYKTFKMDWIPPEIREGQGETELALKHKLPKLIELTDLRGDLQMHTRASDGKMTIMDMALGGEKLGYGYIAITDHSIGIGVTGGLDAKGISAQRKEIEQINSKLKKQGKKIQVLCGIEVNIRANGQLDLPDEALETLDVAVASIHSSFAQDKETVTKRYLGAIHNPHIDIIAHPTGRLLGKRDELNVDWPQVFKACVQTGTALEINAGHDRLDLPVNLAREAARLGVKLVISTDAHSPDGLQAMRFGVAQARRAWLTKEQILNTLDKDEFLKKLKSN